MLQRTSNNASRATAFSGALRAGSLSGVFATTLALVAFLVAASCADSPPSSSPGAVDPTSLGSGSTTDARLSQVLAERRGLLFAKVRLVVESI